MNFVNKLKAILLLAALVPLAVVLIVADMLLVRNVVFEQAMAAGAAVALLIGLLGPQLARQWLVLRPLSRIKVVCEQIKQGDYRGFARLPTEAYDSSDEDEFVRLMRDMNWMAHRIKVREAESQAALMQRDAAQTALLRQKQELEEINRKLSEMAMTDPLTKLSNRRHFFEHLEQEIYRRGRTAAPFSLLLLDIDFFKKINDTYGHQSGDCVLIALAALIRQWLGKSDLAARIGGEEFAVLLPDTNLDTAIARAQALHTAIEHHSFRTADEKTISITCSLGLCNIGPVRSIGSEALYCYADKALYAAKHGGRNTIFCYQEGVCVAALQRPAVMQAVN